VRPFFSFYGGKWRDSPRLYPPPRYGTIVEPFAGSAGYAVRYPSARVVLCDLDPVIVGVWRFLIAAKPSEILDLPDLQSGQTVDDLGVCQEARWLIGFWLNRATTKPCKSPSRWMRDGLRPGSFWGDRVRQTIAGQVEEIRHWKIHEGSYRDCPVWWAASWFIDPPYEVAGKYYRMGSSGIDYGDLGSWVRQRCGQVIACEQEGARWLPFEPLASTKTTRAGVRSREAVWLRG